MNWCSRFRILGSGILALLISLAPRVSFADGDADGDEGLWEKYREIKNEVENIVPLGPQNGKCYVPAIGYISYGISQTGSKRVLAYFYLDPYIVQVGENVEESLKLAGQKHGANLKKFQEDQRLTLASKFGLRRGNPIKSSELYFSSERYASKCYAKTQIALVYEGHKKANVAQDNWYRSKSSNLYDDPLVFANLPGDWDKESAASKTPTANPKIAEGKVDEPAQRLPVLTLVNPSKPSAEDVEIARKAAEEIRKNKTDEAAALKAKQAEGLAQAKIKEDAARARCMKPEARGLCACMRFYPKDKGNACGV